LDPVEPKLVAPKVEYSVLENGLKVASIDRQGVSASLGLFVNAGSRFEDASNFGVSHMTSLMGYKSTAHLSNLRTVKVLEHLGCNTTAKATAGRESIAYSVDVMREFMPLAVPMLIGNVLFPRLLPWEVKAAHKGVDAAREGLAADPDATINELLHKTAYCNNSLGYSPLASSRSMPYFTPDTIRSFMLDHFAPERMVMVGVNVPHDELAKWCMRSFVDYNAIPLKDRKVAKAQYTGGSFIQESDSPFAHVAVGFESAPWGKDAAAVNVLRTLMGGGSAVSKAPGSGITSRLGQVVAQSANIESCSAFNTSYSDSGLFGVYTVCEPQAAGSATTAVATALKGLTNVTADEVNKAKAVLKTDLRRQLDCTHTLMQDIGTQMLLSGKYTGSAEFIQAIDSVTAESVKAAAKSVLSSKPTLVAVGDTHAVPHYSAIEAALK
jgi:processing peptidase subunit alpha